MEDNADEAAYLQGSHLAVAIRDALMLGTGMVDPEGLLRCLGVDIQEITLDAPHLDAIAVWGMDIGRPS